ncbi:MAG TPA: peroxiredoxin, partial [Bryobacteraceae bacterium]|nr:peroxiredoxin [Bryobacteraceae bacterium]
GNCGILRSMLSVLHGPPLPVGDVAPDWTLPDQEGSVVSLTKLLGRAVILIFYPRDETPVCRAQLCEFRDIYSEMLAAGVAVYGVNPGDSGSHAAFRDKLKLPFPLLVDSGGVVAKRYRAKGWLWPVRTVYVVGPDGRIRYSQRGKPSPDQVLAAAR